MDYKEKKREEARRTRTPDYSSPIVASIPSDSPYVPDTSSVPDTSGSSGGGGSSGDF